LLLLYYKFKLGYPPLNVLLAFAYESGDSVITRC